MNTRTNACQAGNSLISIVFLLTASCILGGSPAATGQEARHITPPLSPDLPSDVNVEALRSLSDTPDKPRPPFTIPDENIAQANRLFDVFAWQSFLALNWPAQADGQADTNKTLADAATPRVWEYYVDSAQVYQPDGAAPTTWEAAVSQNVAGHTFWMSGMGIGKPAEMNANGNSEQGSIRRPLLDESLQAFTGPLIDQAGNWVRYEEVLNNVEFDYLTANHLYNLEGQAAFLSTNEISFPANHNEHDHGAMEVKLAWKQMEDTFLTRVATAVRLDGTMATNLYGVVGMHIAVRTQSSPTWIWATFEQVDNTAVNDLEKDSKGRPLHPSFYNPNNPTKPINQLAPKNAGGVRQYNPATGQDDGPVVNTTWDEAITTDPTQATQVTPVPKATDALNHEVQAVLAGIGSVFQYYELIGTQWPAEPSKPAFPNGVSAQADGRLLPASPESILNKVPGHIVPLYLINTTMETFFQNNNQAAGPLAEDDRLPPGLVADPAVVFSTESCAGCHFSAGACLGFKRDANGRFLVTTRVTPDATNNYLVPIFGENAVRGANGNADYSWLMQLRAQSAPYFGTNVTQLTNVLVVNNQILCPAK